MSWRLIRPDPIDGGELPATEFVHPLPLLALAMLAVNDHVLKGAGLLPSVVTGKLSDFAGLFFFPLLLSAVLDVLLYGVNVIARRSVVDASLRASKLAGAAAATAALFTSIKLSAGAAHFYVELIGLIDVFGWLSRAHIVQDPTDLLALPMCALAWWFGRSRLREIPPARLAWIRGRLYPGIDLEALLRRELADVAAVARRPTVSFAALLHGLTPHFVACVQGRSDERAHERAGRALAAWRTSA